MAGGAETYLRLFVSQPLWGTHNYSRRIPATEELCDYFRFGEKEISAWTIKRTLPDEVWIENPQYYEEFTENIKHENLVLDVYDEVAAEINKRDVGIQLRIL